MLRPVPAEVPSPPPPGSLPSRLPGQLARSAAVHGAAVPRRPARLPRPALAAPEGLSAGSPWCRRSRPVPRPHRRPGAPAQGPSPLRPSSESAPASLPPAAAVADLGLCRAADDQQQQPRRRQARPHRPPCRNPTHRPQAVCTEPQRDTLSQRQNFRRPLHQGHLRRVQGPRDGVERTAASASTGAQ
jgi:hypothetical protein